MRFSRFKQHMDGVSPTPRRARIDSHQRKKIKGEKRLKDEKIKKEAAGEGESTEIQDVKREPDIKTEPTDREQASETLVNRSPGGAFGFGALTDERNLLNPGGWPGNCDHHIATAVKAEPAVKDEMMTDGGDSLYNPDTFDFAREPEPEPRGYFPFPQRT